MQATETHVDNLVNVSTQQIFHIKKNQCFSLNPEPSWSNRINLNFFFRISNHVLHCFFPDTSNQQIQEESQDQNNSGKKYCKKLVFILYNGKYAYTGQLRQRFAFKKQ